MKKVGLLFFAVALLGMSGCGGGGATDPTGVDGVDSSGSNSSSNTSTVNVSGTWVDKKYGMTINIVQQGTGLTTSGGKLSGSWKQGNASGKFDSLTFVGQQYEKGLYGYDRTNMSWGGKLAGSNSISGWWMDDEMDRYSTTYTRQ